jgi:hypothetical protein
LTPAQLAQPAWTTQPSPDSQRSHGISSHPS